MYLIQNRLHTGAPSDSAWGWRLTYWWSCWDFSSGPVALHL